MLKHRIDCGWLIDAMSTVAVTAYKPDPRSYQVGLDTFAMRRDQIAFVRNLTRFPNDCMFQLSDAWDFRVKNAAMTADGSHRLLFAPKTSAWYRKRDSWRCIL